MKKQLLLTCLLMASIIFIGFIDINAYSPHYLPDGKNYLSEENFSHEGPDYITTSPFVVKPYTDYVITITEGYMNEMWDPIEVFFYDNSDILEVAYIDEGTMTYYNDGVDGWFYYSFKTTSSTNYLGLLLDDTAGYYVLNDDKRIQLEEGTIFTGYEDYIEGALIDTSAPYFQTSGTVISYFDSPITALEIQSALQAYDAIDGDLSNSIELVTDNYTSNIGTLGTYQITFSVSDSSGNSSEITIEVEIVDVLEPIFTDLGTIQAVYPNSYLVNDILALLSASDNYDGDISALIVLETDGYTINSNIVGMYQMVFSVSDSSGNSQTYYQNIEVVDNEGPIISGVTSIAIGYDSVITEEELIGNLSLADNYDDSSILNLVLESDTYSNNTNALGTYEMKFSVTDSSNNTTYQTVTIEVVDQMGPVVYFNSSIIQTYNDTVMALPDFIQLLKTTNEIEGVKDYYVTIRYDSYTRNANTPGTYHLSLNLKDEFGEEFNKDFEIRVVQHPYDYVQMGEIVQEDTFINEYKEYFIGGISALVLMISNVSWFVILKKKR
ncbi:MAG: hypothetical protein KAU02_05710 [Tenericutes bacterium]|nr:hypothetical protein [Mycoplasmatota bacterium]